VIFISEKERSDKFKKRVATFCQVNYPRIDQDKILNSTLSLRNQNCHNNAVAAFNAGRADSVWLAMAGNDNELVVHFINSKDGKYFDDTWMHNGHYYHIIRKVKPCEFSQIESLLGKTKRMFYDLLGTSADKKAFNKNNNVDI